MKTEKAFKIEFDQDNEHITEDVLFNIIAQGIKQYESHQDPCDMRVTKVAQFQPSIDAKDSEELKISKLENRLALFEEDNGVSLLSVSDRKLIAQSLIKEGYFASQIIPNTSMREALEKVKDTWEMNNHEDTMYSDIENIMPMIRAALSYPDKGEDKTELSEEEKNAISIEQYKKVPLMTVCQAAIIKFGEEIVNTEAEELKMSTEADIDGSRYKITTITTVKELTAPKR